jgi:hypothetical protein
VQTTLFTAQKTSDVVSSQIRRITHLLADKDKNSATHNQGIEALVEFFKKYSKDMLRSVGLTAKSQQALLKLENQYNTLTDSLLENKTEKYNQTI